MTAISVYKLGTYDLQETENKIIPRIQGFTRHFFIHFHNRLITNGFCLKYYSRHYKTGTKNQPLLKGGNQKIYGTCPTKLIKNRIGVNKILLISRLSVS